MPSNIRTGSDRRHVIDAGSEKEIADTLATTNETEAICQDPSVLPVARARFSVRARGSGALP